MTRTTTSRSDPEEAKKELVATLQASRDLGPEMDDALADRFIDRLRALKPEGFDQTKARSDLEALINSARGSDPAGDDSLADDFLAKVRSPQAAAPAPYAYGQYGSYPAPVPPYGGPPAPMQRGGFAQVAPLIVIGVIAVTAIAFTHGAAIWFLWFLIPMFYGYSRRGRSRYYRDQRRAYRHNRTLGPDEVYRPLPPGERPPEIL